MYTISRICDNLKKHGNSKVYLEFLKYSNINEVIDFRIENDKLVIVTAVEFYNKIYFDGTNINENVELVKRIEIKKYEGEEIIKHFHLKKLLIRMLFENVYVTEDNTINCIYNENGMNEFKVYINQIYDMNHQILLPYIKSKNYFYETKSIFSEDNNIISYSEMSIEALKTNIELCLFEDDLFSMYLIYKRNEKNRSLSRKREN